MLRSRALPSWEIFGIPWFAVTWDLRDSVIWRHVKSSGSHSLPLREICEIPWSYATWDFQDLVLFRHVRSLGSWTLPSRVIFLDPVLCRHVRSSGSSYLPSHEIWRILKTKTKKICIVYDVPKIIFVKDQRKAGIFEIIFRNKENLGFFRFSVNINRRKHLEILFKWKKNFRYLGFLLNNGTVEEEHYRFPFS